MADPRRWWVSTVKITCYVETDGDRVSDAAPVLRRFVGQPARNLWKWLKKQGGFRWEQI